jgi:hypothetical protein
LFARPERLGLNEQLGSNPDLGFHGKFVLPPAYFYLDHCVGLVAVEIDSFRHPGDDLRRESGRALELLQGCFDQFCVLGFMFHCGFTAVFKFSRCTWNMNISNSMNMFNNRLAFMPHEHCNIMNTYSFNVFFSMAY